MSEILLNAALKEAVSKKGDKYVVIEIDLTPDYKVKYFPEPAEKEIIKMYYQNQKNNK